jgi:hypothetical protein
MYRLIIPISIFIYLTLLIFFGIYSYSQIDLNLTLSANGIYQSFQKALIYIGYFNRPYSLIIFLIILSLLYFFYLLFFTLSVKRIISFKTVCIIVVLSSVILLFSYPAFSHDFFNYMFDARIITKYQLNPYLFRALDFPGDLWTRFMHWTHRTYPYGPLWLVITVPFSFFGFGKFTLTLFNFKLLFAVFHLGNIFLIYKILRKLSPTSVKTR